MYNNIRYFKIIKPFSKNEVFLNDESSTYFETVKKMLDFQEKIDLKGRSLKGLQIYSRNNLFDIQVKEVIFDIPKHKSEEFDGRQDLVFTCKCKGSDESIYDVEIIISKEWCIIYNDCSCPNHEKAIKEGRICKHAFAALYWLQTNLPSLQNIEVVPETDIGYEKCIFNGFSKDEYVITTYKTLTKHIDSYEITKLRLYEKACRYLVKGLKSMDDKVSPWTDAELPIKFRENGEDFDQFMANFLKNDSMHNLSREDDERLVDFTLREPYRHFTFLKDRISYIGYSIALNPFEVSNVQDLQRIIDTYKDIKKISVAGEEIDVKEICIPGNYKLLVIEISKINEKQYNELKVMNGVEPFYYKVNRNAYMAFKINIK